MIIRGEKSYYFTINFLTPCGKTDLKYLALYNVVWTVDFSQHTILWFIWISAFKENIQIFKESFSVAHYMSGQLAL